LWDSAPTRESENGLLRKKVSENRFELFVVLAGFLKWFLGRTMTLSKPLGVVVGVVFV
jgi:hypothetical protein